MTKLEMLDRYAELCVIADREALTRVQLAEKSGLRSALVGEVPAERANFSYDEQEGGPHCDLCGRRLFSTESVEAGRCISCRRGTGR